MAARRLIALLFMLMVISTVLAALAPEDRDEDSTDASTTTSEPERGEAKANGKQSPAADSLVVAVGVGPQPDRVEAVVGDRISLLVRRKDPSQVAIPELGRLDYATPGSPARFDLLLRSEGLIEVVDGDDELIATIDVGEAGRDKKDAEKGSGQGAGSRDDDSGTGQPDPDGGSSPDEDSAPGQGAPSQPTGVEEV